MREKKESVGKQKLDQDGGSSIDLGGKKVGRRCEGEEIKAFLER